MTYRLEVDECPRCHGHGWETTAEWNDQYDRTHTFQEICRECGGKGEIIIEIED
jgi:DnaJ-class molecular chaperone